MALDPANLYDEETILAALVAHHAHLAGQDGEAFVIHDMDVSSLSFMDVDFNGIDISGSTLLGCTFVRCSFIGADLRECVLDNSQFIECDFTNALLRLAQFQKGSMYGCQLHGVDMEQMVLHMDGDGTIWHLKKTSYP